MMKRAFGRVPRRRLLPLLSLGALLALGGVLTVRACGQNGQSATDLRGPSPPPGGSWLETLDVSQMEQEWGSPRPARSVDANPLRLNGTAYAHGIGTHAASDFTVNLKGAATRFLADAGVDDETDGRGTVRFEVWVDGRRAFQSKVLKGRDAPERVSVDLTGAKTLRLVVTDGGDGINHDHADWAGAVLLLKDGAGEKPAAVGVADEPPIPLWMGPDPPQPAIHGPRVVGGTPGRPFLFRIPATGAGPLRFAAKNLPDGVTLDPATGILSGTLKRDGVTVVDLDVSGPKGKGTRKLVLVAGKNKLALTPPLGWNSWNVWGTSVDAAKVRAAADAFVETGLAAHGFAYVNMDDGWEGARGADGRLPTNAKFGDMKALADYVHAKGLKLGIYSSPGPKTCAGYEGSWGHEAVDARTWAAWGIDYLKYDWCSYGQIAPPGNSRGAFVWPYRKMQRALDAAPRDIAYSLCQYGMDRVWEWGASVNGNAWRTTGDITDTWNSMASIGFGQAGLEKWAGPGRWNDPDMLVVGRVGWGPNLHPTRLKPNEQITHVTLWCLLAAPLLIGCDLTQLDPFTRALLTNDDVLDVNQDPLGVQAGRRRQDGPLEVWSRPLFDGTVAVGLFNRGREAATVRVGWSDMGLSGSQPVRDLWQRKNLGAFRDGYAARVPAHGALLFKVGRPQRTEYVP